MRSEETTKQALLHTLGELIRDSGRPIPKRHGNYWSLDFFDSFYFSHDDYNNSVSIVSKKNNITIKYFGIDFGGFETKLKIKDFEEAILFLTYIQKLKFLEE